MKVQNYYIFEPDKSDTISNKISGSRIDIASRKTQDTRWKFGTVPAKPGRMVNISVSIYGLIKNNKVNEIVFISITYDIEHCSS